MTKTYFPAADIGGTSTRLGLVDLQQRRVLRAVQDRTPDDPKEFGPLIARLVARCGLTPGPIGVASAPQLDARGVVARWPNRPGYVGAGMGGDFTNLGFDPVFFDDGTAACHAVHHASDCATTTVYIGLGTGVAGGAIAADTALIGREKSAMDIGHLPVPVAAGMACRCGRTACLQTIVSAAAVAERCRGAGLNVAELPVLAASGDARANEILADIVVALSQAIGTLIVVLDPDAIVIDAGNLDGVDLIGQIESSVRKTHPGARISANPHKGTAPLIGAAIGASRVLLAERGAPA